MLEVGAGVNHCYGCLLRVRAHACGNNALLIQLVLQRIHCAMVMAHVEEQDQEHCGAPNAKAYYQWVHLVFLVAMYVLCRKLVLASTAVTAAYSG